MDRLAELLAEEEGRVLGVAREPGEEPRRLPIWVMPLGVAASVLLVLGIGIAFWPRHEPVPDRTEQADNPLDTKPVWFSKPDAKPQQQTASAESSDEMIVGGKPVPRSIASRPRLWVWLAATPITRLAKPHRVMKGSPPRKPAPDQVPPASNLKIEPTPVATSRARSLRNAPADGRLCDRAEPATARRDTAAPAEVLPAPSLGPSATANSTYLLVKTGLRFSMKAAMPSFWSSVANSE